MKPPIRVLREMRLTEKGNRLSANLGQYTFEVFGDATKPEIRSAVEATFNVKVTRVNTLHMPEKPTGGRRGRPGNKSGFKKAIVTLKEGDKIELT
jgi:large subunit ribosomal protein L23